MKRALLSSRVTRARVRSRARAGEARSLLLAAESESRAPSQRTRGRGSPVSRAPRRAGSRSRLSRALAHSRRERSGRRREWRQDPRAPLPARTPPALQMPFPPAGSLHRSFPANPRHWRAFPRHGQPLASRPPPCRARSTHQAGALPRPVGNVVREPTGSIEERGPFECIVSEPCCLREIAQRFSRGSKGLCALARSGEHRLCLRLISAASSASGTALSASR